MLVVLVELGARLRIVEAVEVGEQVGRVGRRFALRRAASQVVDDRLRVDLLLDVERRRVDDEVGPVLPVLAAPDELRVADLDLARLQQAAAPAPSSRGCARRSR